MKKQIIRRSYQDLEALSDLPPLLKKIYAGRGILTKEELEKGLEKLAPYQLLTGIEEAVNCLFEALKANHHIMIIGDFDADGATSTALAVSCLQTMGATCVSYLVPNRFEYGYGLTPEIVAVAANRAPDLLVTVDNGISSGAGVLKARELGIKVIVTDHHLPPSNLPEAHAIVNPNKKGDGFPSKNLAGVGVIFYVMMALRAKLRDVHWFSERGIAEVNMAAFLDLVALGTVADVVTLDRNNRILIHQGLARIRAGKLRPGIRALLDVAGRKIDKTVAADLGFAVAPRLNAAGRLDDMSLGIACLLSESADTATQLAWQLDMLNKQRQQIEAGMRQQATENLANLQLASDLPAGLCLFEETWHQGIIGILASRIKDNYHRPVFAFALANDHELKGSGRSIPGFHLKDALERIVAESPSLVTKFGGHAMAAGLSLPRDNLAKFAELFSRLVAQDLSQDALLGVIHSDGELAGSAINIETAETLQKAGPWGQGFPEPVFDGYFKIVSQRVLKDKHLKLVLRGLNDFFMVDAMAFNIDAQEICLHEDDTLHIAYKLDINEYRGSRNVQLLIEHFYIASARR
jgi:single-stranded-DNA-specific exonuclease